MVTPFSKQKNLSAHYSISLLAKKLRSHTKINLLEEYFMKNIGFL